MRDQLPQEQNDNNQVPRVDIMNKSPVFELYSRNRMPHIQSEDHNQLKRFES